MSDQDYKEVKLVFSAAIRHAINTIGIASFKSTSMFGSNDVAKADVKNAA